MRHWVAGLALLAGSASGGMARAANEFTVAESGAVTSWPLAARFSAVSSAGADPEAAAPSDAAARVPAGLGAERARILLRSLTVPGWGQATLGRPTSAKVFLLAEAGVWASFVSFRVQEAMRRHTYETTARIFAGIDLHDRDEEFRRIVGIYPSSDYYNLYVVRRDAAALYYDDPVLYEQYIAEHELQGRDTWSWAGPESFDRYYEERKLTRRAALRANAMLGLAIANRLVSALHAARHAGMAPAAAAHSWNFECGPRASDPTAMGVGLQVRF